MCNKCKTHTRVQKISVKKILNIQLIILHVEMIIMFDILD